MMASRFKTWVAKWQKTRYSTQDTVMAIQEVRRCAKAIQDMPMIVLRDLDEALATMNEATGLGADHFGPRFIKSLPKDGRQKFVDLLNQCEEQVAWPWQVYVTLVCLLAKERRETHLIADNDPPHLESYEESFLPRCGASPRRGSGTMRERELAAAGGTAPTGGR